MDVSIIIVNYNTCTLTRNCLKSIFKQTKDINFEVIVSDNGSNDGSIKMIKTEFPHVILIENNTNLGFGTANNKGLLRATGKYIFLLNSDTILLNNAVKEFFEYMESAPKTVACCGCLLQNQEGENIHSYGDFHTLSNCLEEWVWRGIKHKLFRNYKLLKYDNPKYMHGNSFLVQYVTGADLFIRTNVIKKCGLFDTVFFMYSEDMELQRRYQSYGYNSSIIVTAKIAHLVGGSNKKKPLAKNITILKSMFLYKKKELSSFKYFIFRFVFKLFYCPTIILKKYTFADKFKYLSDVISLKP